MKIEYQLAGSSGKSSFEALRHTHFLLAPNTPHPFLTLGDYFGLLSDFILSCKTEIESQFTRHCGNQINFDCFDLVQIISQKHGALYHVAKVIFKHETRSFPISLCTALGKERCLHLAKEYRTTFYLNRKFEFQYLPEVYTFREIPLSRGGNKEIIAVMMAQWLEGYHEWHITYDDSDGQTQNVLIWDVDSHDRIAEEQISYQLFLKIAKILTLYYDTQTFEQILSWHNSAGDFVINASNEGVKVKLTTVREYGQLVSYPEDPSFNPIIPLVYFFLDLSLRIRLDKLQGTGVPVLADEKYLMPVIHGFFNGLNIIRKTGRDLPITSDHLLELLRSFSEDEIRKIMIRLLETYEDPSELELIKRCLNIHIRQLKGAIENIEL